MPKVAALLLSAVAFCLLSGHTDSYKFTPAAGQTAPAGLDELLMEFAREVRITSFRLVAVPGGTDVRSRDLDLGNFDTIKPLSKIPRGFIREVEVKFAELQPGDYAFDWSVVARDGDVFNGRSHFVVSANSANRAQ